MEPARHYQPLRRPLIGLALAYIAGTWGAVMIGGLPPAWAGAAAALLLILSLVFHLGDGYLRRRSVASVFVSSPSCLSRSLPVMVTLILYLAVAAAAWFAAGLRLEDPSPRALSALMEKPRESLELEGVIVGDPVARSSWKGDRILWTFPLRLDSIHRLIPWQTARGTVRVIMPAPPEGRRPQYGDRWRLTGILVDHAHFPDKTLVTERTEITETEIPSSKIENAESSVECGSYAPAFLPEAWLPAPEAKAQAMLAHSKEVLPHIWLRLCHAKIQSSSRPILDWLNRRYTFRADPDAAVFLGNYRGNPLLYACFRFRRKCAAILTLGIGHRPEVAGLLQALLLGRRQELPEKLRTDFIATGTYHIFAISGQHVAIISLFIIVVLQSYRISRVKWFLLLAPMLVVFTISTGMSTSAVRGCLMALLCFLGPLVGRKPDVPSALALAALIILAVDPFQLFSFGFLLSFMVVAGLVILCPVILKQIVPAIEPDPLRLQPESKLVYWGRRVTRIVLFLFVTSLVAWLVSMPLIARWFNLVSPIALLANLVAIPMVTLMLLAGWLSIIFGLAVPVLGEIFNFANLVLVSFLLWMIDLMARIPYGHIYVRSPPFWSLAIWYATLAAWVVWRRWAWTWMLGPVLLALTLGMGGWGSRHSVELDVMNMGDGPVCFVNVPGGNDLLINPGSRYPIRKVIRRLRRQGVDKLKAIVLTGVNSAHAGGVPAILQAIPVSELWIPSDARRTKTLRAAITVARVKGTEIHTLTNGATIPLPGGTTLTILFPALKGLSGSAWLLRRGAVAVMCADNVTSQMADVVRARDWSLQPDMFIENRMHSDPVRHPGILWPAGRHPEWHIICTRSFIREEQSETPVSSRLIRLAPGQGIGIYLVGIGSDLQIANKD